MSSVVAMKPGPSEIGDASATSRGRIGHDSHSILEFQRSASGRTWFSDRYVEFPLHLTRQLYLDPGSPDIATLYLQSASGGLFQGDRHRIDVQARAEARAHLTTQGATKVHSMRDEADHAEQHVHLDVGENAFVEWVADPLILFPDSAVRTTLRIDLQPGATAFSTEGFLCHDPEGGRDPRFRMLETEMAIHGPDGVLLALDRQRIDGMASRALSLTGAGGGYRTQGTVFIAAQAHPGLEQFLDQARAWIAGLEGVAAGVGPLPNQAGAWARVLAVDAVRHQRAIVGLWQIFRHAIPEIEAPIRPK